MQHQQLTILSTPFLSKDFIFDTFQLFQASTFKLESEHEKFEETHHPYSLLVISKRKVSPLEPKHVTALSASGIMLFPEHWSTTEESVGKKNSDDAIKSNVTLVESIRVLQESATLLGELARGFTSLETLTDRVSIIVH